MSARFAVDTKAVDYLRESRPAPPLLTALEILLPLTVFWELFAGAFASERAAENLEAITRLASLWPVLLSTRKTPESTAVFAPSTAGNVPRGPNQRETTSGSPRCADVSGD